MRIKALRDFFVPNKKGFKNKEEYTVSDEDGAMYIERGLAEEVKHKDMPAAKSEDKQSEKKSKK